MHAPLALLLIITTLLLSTPLSAQPDPAQPEPSPSEPLPPAPDEPLPPQRTPAEEAAQAQVTRARKLARLQRYPEAIALVEEAYLTLEDPELLRMLGEWHMATQSYDKAVGLFDSYLADPAVGDMAKEPVRLKRDEALAALGLEREQEEDEDKPDPGWTFFPSGSNTAGRIYLMLGGHLTQNNSPSFSVTVGEGADARKEEYTWAHGGLGVRFEVGTYVIDNLGVGLSVSNDWMSWEHRAPTLPFQTTLYSGVRPELAVNGRYFFEAGFFLGVGVGGDLMWLTEGTSYQEACAAAEAQCVEDEDVVIEEGVQGWRLFIGGLAGYRTELAEDWTIGAEAGLRYIPVFVTRTDLAGELPSFTDGSTMFNFAVVVHTNL